MEGNFTVNNFPKNGSERVSFIRGNGLHMNFKETNIPLVNILKGNGYDTKTMCLGNGSQEGSNSTIQIERKQTTCERSNTRETWTTLR